MKDIGDLGVRPDSARISMLPGQRIAARYAPPRHPVRVAETLDIGDRALFFLERSMRPLFSHIKKRLSNDCSLVLHIASTWPGEGTSTVARELAHVAASATWCRVLLLDGNPSSCDQACYFGLPALPDIARGWAENMRLEAIALTIRAARFDIAALPMFGKREACTLPPTAVRAIYDALRREYQLTIVDCPPILGDSDVALLSDYADGVALVVREGKTRLSAIACSKAKVEAGGGRIKGIILNGSRKYVPAFISDKL